MFWHTATAAKVSSHIGLNTGARDGRIVSLEFVHGSPSDYLSVIKLVSAIKWCKASNVASIIMPPVYAGHDLIISTGFWSCMPWFLTRETLREHARIDLHRILPHLLVIGRSNTMVKIGPPQSTVSPYIDLAIYATTCTPIITQKHVPVYMYQCRSSYI